MKMRTKIITAALFAAILGATHSGMATEQKAFAITAPSQVALDYSLRALGQSIPVAPEEANFVKLAQR